MKVEYRIGDCVEVLKEYPENHFDSCVTDPPYGLEFMGHSWDKVEVYGFSEAWGKAVYRVLKPGAWLLAFGGTRTYHRMTCALEDVGFEIRDCMMWLYGSGFPKSHDVSKAIDKHLGMDREVIGLSSSLKGRKSDNNESFGQHTQNEATNRFAEGYPITTPKTPEAQKWQGWGTALKPAWEPIVVARKPLDGTVASNTLKWGTGGINVDGCRIGVEEIFTSGGKKGGVAYGDWAEPVNAYHLGRWPSNLLLDEDSAKLLGDMSGDRPSSFRANGSIAVGETGSPFDNTSRGPILLNDGGGASRFFYTAKASRGERERGVRGAGQFMDDGREPGSPGGTNPRNRGAEKQVKNFHPTVKPLDLMQYLVRLVTPEDGICLDPFLGSGTTLLALRLEGLSGLGIEKNAEYEPIIKGRLEYFPPPIESFEVESPDVHPTPTPFTKS